MQFRQYLLQNLRSFCISVAIPILLFGVFSFFLTTNYISSTVEDNNLNVIEHVRQSLDSMLLDIRSLDITLSTIPTFSIYLKNILQDPQSANKADLQIYFRLLTGLLVNKTAVNRITHSICIFYPNESNHFFTSLGSLATDQSYYDTSWFESCLALSSEKEVGTVWLPSHSIGQYPYDSTDVVTYLQRMSVGHGVLICNFNVKQVNSILSETFRMRTQCILITDSSGRLLFSCDHSGKLPEDVILALTPDNTLSGSSVLSLNGQRYYVSASHSDAFSLNYYSIVETSELYSLPNALIRIMIGLLLLCFFITILLAYRNSVRSKQYLDSLLATFEAASRGETLPDMPRDLNDRTLSTITKTIQNFLRTDLLQMQLSEKMNQNRVLELTALQAQMNPHFLYNTLDTIYWRIIGLTHGPSQETKMIEDLSDILRYALQNEETTVSLRQEIENTLAYVDIQTVRFGSNFQVYWSIAENAWELSVLKLILQPLIENCLLHAFVKENSLDILVEAEVQGDLLMIICTDNGAGIQEDQLAQIRQKLNSSTTFEQHIGIFNTDKRIRLAYGDGYGLMILSKCGQGTQVTLVLPCIPHTSFKKVEKKNEGFNPWRNRIDRDRDCCAGGTSRT